MCPTRSSCGMESQRTQIILLSLSKTMVPWQFRAQGLNRLIILGSALEDESERRKRGFCKV